MFIFSCALLCETVLAWMAKTRIGHEYKKGHCQPWWQHIIRYRQFPSCVASKKIVDHLLRKLQLPRGGQTTVLCLTTPFPKATLQTPCGSDLNISHSMLSNRRAAQGEAQGSWGSVGTGAHPILLRLDLRNAEALPPMSPPMCQTGLTRVLDRLFGQPQWSICKTYLFRLYHMMRTMNGTVVHRFRAIKISSTQGNVPKTFFSFVTNILSPFEKLAITIVVIT